LRQTRLGLAFSEPVNEQTLKELSMNETILEVRDVSFRHRLSRHEYSGTILNKVNLSVTRSEILILIGPSGSGKTSLLRLLNRLEDPEEGMILYEGKDIREQRPQDLRRQVVLVAQEPYLIEGTVRENLLIPFDSKTIDDGVEQKGRDVLLSVGLNEDFLDRSVQHLSVGEKQRICIARALMISPKVLLLDEPTSALDPGNREILSRTVRKINGEEQITFIVVTHTYEFARSLGGRQLTMKHGEIFPS
jgi:putative ABC transport system ATP-binding protein